MEISRDAAKAIQEIQETSDRTMTRVSLKVTEEVGEVMATWDLKVEPLSLEVTFTPEEEDDV